MPIAPVAAANMRKALALTQASHSKTARRALGAVATILPRPQISRSAMIPRHGPLPAKAHMRSRSHADVPDRRLIAKGSNTAIATAF
jgi:hypothetical protein